MSDLMEHSEQVRSSEWILFTAVTTGPGQDVATDKWFFSTVSTNCPTHSTSAGWLYTENRDTGTWAVEAGLL